MTSMATKVELSSTTQAVLPPLNPSRFRVFKLRRFCRPGEQVEAPITKKELAQAESFARQTLQSMNVQRKMIVSQKASTAKFSRNLNKHFRK